MAEVHEADDRVARAEPERLAHLGLVDHLAGAPHRPEPAAVGRERHVLDGGGHGVPVLAGAHWLVGTQDHSRDHDGARSRRAASFSRPT